MSGAAPLLFAVGDGNHSLATAKQCYENLKKVTPEEPVGNAARPVCPGGGGEQPRRRPPVRAHPPRPLRRGPGEVFMAAFRAAYPNAYEGQGRGPCHRAASGQGHDGFHHRAGSQGAAGGGHAPGGHGRLSEGARRRGGLHPRRRGHRGVGLASPATWASCCRPWARSSCSRPSWPTACCPARPSPWATPRISGTMWRLGRSSKKSFPQIQTAPQAKACGAVSSETWQKPRNRRGFWGERLSKTGPSASGTSG